MVFLRALQGESVAVDRHQACRAAAPCDRGPRVPDHAGAAPVLLRPGQLDREALPRGEACALDRRRRYVAALLLRPGARQARDRGLAREAGSGPVNGEWYHYVIHENPDDFPRSYVIRRCQIGPRGMALDCGVWGLADTLELARLAIPDGHTRFLRDPSDAP